ncbi:hypothetical protein ACIPEN_20710 [Herbaspirillum chlorophenolicum]|uniref:SMODS and SLOG-associating 2TM effector domain-containing protein n=1 Tax=Herbaspirillum chlorophenolicum TaxID=211589 RepID=A0ABW8F4P8_9BURK
MEESEVKELADEYEFAEALKSATGNISAAFELTLRQREFEIGQLTQRNNFFMIFQGVIIAGLIQSGGNAMPILNVSVCVLGVVVSLLQANMAAGAKYWQMRWERATRTLEIYLLETLRHKKTVFQLFTVDESFLTEKEKEQIDSLKHAPCRGEKADPVSCEKGYITKNIKEDLGSPLNPANWLVGKKPSVSKIPIYVGWSLAIFWSSLVYRSVSICPTWALIPLTGQ